MTDQDSLADRILELGCLNYTSDRPERREQARELLAEDPSIAGRDIFVASALGDVAAVREHLAADPARARTRGGPREWEPLLYAVYSRIAGEGQGHDSLEVVRLLLAGGADPNAGFLWNANVPPFTALTGAFGEGEAGPVNQPEHPECLRLARLLLEAGADPDDEQTLYNRMFTRGTAHLELLFEFGLGGGGDGVWFQRLGDRMRTPERMLAVQLKRAVEYDHADRVELLARHGVELDQVDERTGHTPYQLALLSGNARMAQLLLECGAEEVTLHDLDAFAAACMLADEERARALLARDSTLVERLGERRAELLNRAAGDGRSDALRLMAGLGFDVNEVRGTAPLHQAAWAGHVEAAALLIELGADPRLRDQKYDSTPLGWARFNQQAQIAAFLERFEP